MKQATFLRATIYHADGTQSEVLIGLCDRMAAQSKFGKGVQELETTDPTAAEEWMAYTAYKAAVRLSGSKQTFEKWLESYLGLEFDDGAADPGTPPA